MRTEQLSSPRRRRTGNAALEFLLLLPVLLALTLGMVQFSLMLAARQQVVAASREGARVAALGGSETEIEQAVRDHLGQGSLTQATVLAVLEDENHQPIPSGKPVEVWVAVDATSAVPDLLSLIGFSMKDRQFVGRTVMRKE